MIRMTVAALAVLLAAEAQAQTMSPQPSLPVAADQAIDDPPAKPGSPVVDQIVRQDPPPLVVRKRVARARPRIAKHRVVHALVPRTLERPALAGVELLAPLPPPGEPPHLVVPVPAYPLEAIASGLTSPPPPIVCHGVRRDPYAPDPHLYREIPVACEPDNP